MVSSLALDQIKELLCANNENYRNATVEKLGEGLVYIVVIITINVLKVF